MSNKRTKNHETSYEEKRETKLKSAVLKKTSGILAMLLIISVLTPILAFAQIGDVTYKSGTVNGEVYYDHGVPANVYVGITPENAGTATNVYATYARTVNGITYYSFTYTPVTTYNYVVVTDLYDSVTDKKVNYTIDSGTPGTPPSSPAVPVTVGADNKVDKGVLEGIIKGNPNAAILIPGESVALPAAAFGAGVSLKVVTSTGSYIVLPLNKINLTDLAKDLGVAVSDLFIKVSVKAVTGADATKVSDGVKKVTGATQKAAAVDFIIGVIGKDGKDAVLNFSYLGNTYVERGIVTDSAVDPNKATGVVVDPTTGDISFVPTVFTTNADGKATATIKRNTTSIYTVVETNKSLSDLAGHWAKADVDLLVNKLVVQGATDTTFEPQRSITRAEFAALVVRALGLNTGDKTASTFKDVAADAWYTGIVNAAATANLIQGYDDGTFRPNALITREELSALVVRALKFAGQEATVSATEQATLLAKYTDASTIKWGQNEVAAAVKSGIVNGQTDTTLATNSNATRAEAATMLKRFLSGAKFIN